MLAIKDFYKTNDNDVKILNKLRQFCKEFKQLYIEFEEFSDPLATFKIIHRGEEYSLRLFVVNDLVTKIFLLVPHCQCNFVSQTNSTMQDPSKTIETVDPAQDSTTQEIVTFVDDTATQEASLPVPTSPEHQILATGSEIRRHTIEDILQRPVKITQQKWKTSQVQNTDIYSVAFPDAILNASDIVRDKIQNFTFLRADICVRVVVNASTFQQGKLLAYFAPFSRVVGQRAKLNDHLPAKTAFPGVRIDASTGNTGSLRIPFVSPYTHYNLTTQQGDMGNFRITVLNQLKTLTDCSVTVFAWFENVELSVPTARANRTTLVNAQSPSNENDKAMIVKLIKDGIIQVRKDADTGELTFLNPFKSQVAEDLEKSRKGIVTETLEHVAGVARGGQMIPVIGKFFKPVEWISNSLSKVSALMGLSKPTSVQTQEKFQNVPGFGYTHTDGLDQSLTLACKQDNQLEMRGDLFGSSVDEMDINYICSHSCWFETFKWTTAIDPLVNPQIKEIAVHPGICPFVTSNYHPTLLAFCSAPFESWRGGLKFKIQAAKTAYHSGRLRISFVPSGLLAQNYNLDKVNSWILDLRTSDELEFEIPYISNTQYKKVILAPPNAAPNPSATTGILVFEVLNALRAPDTVEQSVEINLWIAGASDYQVAIPDFSRYRIGNGTATTTTKAAFTDPDIETLVPNRPKREINTNSEDYDYSSGYETQVLGAFQDQGFNDMGDAAKMFEMSKVDTLTPKKLTIGEDITNIRSLIKRFGWVGEYSLQNRFLSVDLSCGSFRSEESSSVCALDYFSWMYRFYRGGIRYKIITDLRPLSAGSIYNANDGAGVAIETAEYHSVEDNPQLHVSLNVGADALPKNPSIVASQGNEPAPVTWRGTNFSHRTFPRLNPYTEVTAPYYGTTPILPITAPNGIALDDVFYNSLNIAYAGNQFNDYNYDATEARYVNTPTDAVRADIHLWTAAADDFSFGWIVGPPYLKDNT
nr:MAG: polyprotein 2 [Picornavirales sp.]